MKHRSFSMFTLGAALALAGCGKDDKAKPLPPTAGTPAPVTPAPVTPAPVTPGPGAAGVPDLSGKTAVELVELGMEALRALTKLAKEAGDDCAAFGAKLETQAKADIAVFQAAMLEEAKRRATQTPEQRAAVQAEVEAKFSEEWMEMEMGPLYDATLRCEDDPRVKALLAPPG